MASLAEGNFAVDEHGSDPVRMLLGIIISGGVDDRILVKQYQVSPIAFFYLTALFHAEHTSGQGRHSSDGFGKSQYAIISNILSQYPREGAEQAWMRFAIQVRYAV